MRLSINLHNCLFQVPSLKPVSFRLSNFNYLLSGYSCFFDGERKGKERTEVFIKASCSFIVYGKSDPPLTHGCDFRVWGVLKSSKISFPLSSSTKRPCLQLIQWVKKFGLNIFLNISTYKFLLTCHSEVPHWIHHMKSSPRSRDPVLLLTAFPNHSDIGLKTKT